MNKQMRNDQIQISHAYFASERTGDPRIVGVDEF